MASMKDIKRRKESIQSTGQITKAMKLVATVKLQKARGAPERREKRKEVSTHKAGGRTEYQGSFGSWTVRIEGGAEVSLSA